MQSSATYIQTALPPTQDDVQIDQYHVLLDGLGIGYQEEEIYLQSEGLTADHTIVLHLSVIVSLLPELLMLLRQVLCYNGLAFRLVKNKQVAKHVLDGKYGPALLSKVVTFYFSSPAVASQTALELVEITKGFAGPRIPGHWQLGQILFTDAAGKSVFAGLCQAPQLSGKILQSRYKPILLLKEDVKGSVLQAKYIKGFLRVGTCVIKQGRQHMWSDYYGRDIQDRLKWQQHLHQQLKGTVNVPTILELFYDQGDAFLSMEFIKGESLNQRISKIYNGRSWQQLDHPEKDRLLGYLLGIGEILRRLHAKGIIHRDLSPANFLLTAKDEIFLIDLEMAYDARNHQPAPVFGGGTDGFMSPQQLDNQQPDFQEDVYGFGGLMVYFFTNLPPVKFDARSPQHLEADLYHFIADTTLTQLSTACLDTVPEKRPALDNVLQRIAHIRSQWKGLASKPSFAPLLPETQRVATVVQQAVNGLVLQATSDPSWLFGKVTRSLENSAHTEPATVQGGGLLRPIAGALLLLDTCPLSVDMTELKTYLVAHTGDLQRDYLRHTAAFFPGLVQGKAGMAITAAAAASAGLLPSDHAFSIYLKESFSKDADTLDLMTGIAGQGMALLYCKEYFNNQLLKAMLQHYVSVILLAQQPDGSWPEKPGAATGKPMPPNLALGAAGVLYFLMGFYEQLPDPHVKQAILNGLSSLTASLTERKSWLRARTKKTTYSDDPSLCYGITGIGLVFIKAYQLFHDPLHRQATVSVLQRMPPYPLTHDFTLATGLAGIGLLYVQIARTFGSKEYQQKAGWIASVFSHSLIHTGEQTGRWNMDHTERHDGSLLTGVVGPMLFLCEYLKGINSQS
jgi:serine/threonine protein kinase